MVRNAIHSDASLCNTITSTGAEDVRFFLFLFLTALIMHLVFQD